MKTWRIMLNEPPTADLLATALQSQIGADAMALEQKTEVGIWQWTMNSSSELRSMMEEHQDILRYNKGAKTFWFDGGANATLSRRFFIDYGDGSTKDFALPFRWLYAPSCVFSVNYATVTAWTINGRVLSFTSAPAAGSLIHLEKARMRFKCFVVVDSSDKMYQMADSFKSFESKSMIFREFPN